jgi:hypothetical protein
MKDFQFGSKLSNGKEWKASLIQLFGSINIKQEWYYKEYGNKKEKIRKLKKLSIMSDFLVHNKQNEQTKQTRKKNCSPPFLILHTIEVSHILCQL